MYFEKGAGKNWEAVRNSCRRSVMDIKQRYKRLCRCFTTLVTQHFLVSRGKAWSIRQNFWNLFCVLCVKNDELKTAAVV